MNQFIIQYLGHRDNQEDAYSVSDGVFVVSDGMGGHARGEEASRVAVDVFTHCAHDWKLAAQVADDQIQDLRLPWERPPGCTVTAMRVYDGHASIAHLGDSAAYLVSGGTVRQLTPLHRIGENRLIACLGADARTRDHIFVTELDVKPGDRVVLATDGLEDLFPREWNPKDIKHPAAVPKGLGGVLELSEGEMREYFAGRESEMRDNLTLVCVG